VAKNDDDERIEAFGKRGPAPRDLDSEERTRFLRLIQGGLGIHLALEHIGIGHARYKRTLANDPDFDAEVKHSLACRRERLASLAYKLAAGNKEEGREPDIFLLKFMINRDDQAERYREEQREKRRLAREKAGAKGAGDAGDHTTVIHAAARAVADIEGPQWRAQQQQRISEAPSQPPPSAPSTDEPSS
jgi:hypothetical protein